MFEQFSYKKKFLFLMVIFGMLLAASYKRSFSVLIDSIKENNKLTEQSISFQKKTKNINRLMSEIAYLDKVIGKENVTREQIQQDIVNFIALKQPQISITDLQPIHVFQNNDHLIITNVVEVSGSLNQLLQLGYSFEKELETSRVVAMSFIKRKNQQKKEELYLKIIFQNYENFN